MNILLFSKICARSGVGNHIRQLAESLASSGHHVFIASSTNQQGIENRENLKFVSINVKTKNPIRFIQNIANLRQLIKKEHIEIVHCHHRLAALYMRVYRMLWYIPVVYTLHSAQVPHDFIHRIMTYVGDRAIAVSTEVKEFMIDKLKIPGEKIDVVLNGVNPPDISGAGYNRNVVIEKYHIPNDRYILLMNSRIAEVKNHLLMVEAVRNLPEKIRTKIVVVCTGEKSGQYYERILQEINEYGLQNFFIFVGWVDPYEILSVADFLFCPSKAEGFALNCLEAFFMKVPVARTKTGGYADMEKVCIPISMNDYHSINDVISVLVKNGANSFESLTEDAYCFASENLTIDRMSEKIFKIYERVIESRGG